MERHDGEGAMKGGLMIGGLGRETISGHGEGAMKGGGEWEKKEGVRLDALSQRLENVMSAVASLKLAHRDESQRSRSSGVSSQIALSGDARSLRDETTAPRANVACPPAFKGTMNSFNIQDYRFLRKLGTGKASIVHHAVHIASGRDVAIKCYDMMALDDVEMAMVRNEVDLHAQIDNPSFHIIQFYQFGWDESNAYVVLEYAAGGDLFTTLSESMVPKLSERATVRRCIRPVASAVAHMHRQGILHRDIKLENLLLMGKGNDACCKLGDFGFATDTNKCKPVSRLGTLQYLAPELIECDKNKRDKLRAANKAGYGKPVDCWAIGVVAYECLHGSVPFPGNDMSEIRDAIGKSTIRVHRNISFEARDFILACLDINAETRITAEEMLRHPWLLQNN